MLLGRCKLKQGGNSPAVQWLGLLLSLPRAQVQSLVRELRSHSPRGVAKTKTKQNQKKQQGNTTTHLLEWPESKTLTAPNTGKTVEKRKLSLIVDGDADQYSHFGRSFSSFLPN